MQDRTSEPYKWVSETVRNNLFSMKEHFVSKSIVGCCQKDKYLVFSKVEEQMTDTTHQIALEFIIIMGGVWVTVTDIIKLLVNLCGESLLN